MFLLYHAYVYLEFLILACTIYILASYAAEDIYTADNQKDADGNRIKYYSEGACDNSYNW